MNRPAPVKADARTTRMLADIMMRNLAIFVTVAISLGFFGFIFWDVLQPRFGDPTTGTNALNDISEEPFDEINDREPPPVFNRRHQAIAEAETRLTELRRQAQNLDASIRDAKSSTRDTWQRRGQNLRDNLNKTYQSRPTGDQQEAASE